MIRSFKTFSSHSQSLCVGLVFLTLSILTGSWLARLPEVQSRLDLSESRLGIALLGASAGAFVSTSASGWALSRIPEGKATLISAVLFCIFITLPPLAWDLRSLFIALFLVGLASGFMDVAMNAAAASIEEHEELKIMSSCHGMFSLGGMIGAGSAGLIAGTGVPLSLHLAILAFVMIAVNMINAPVLLKTPKSNAGGAVFVIPDKALLGLAFIGFCFMMAEGAIADWSAVYLKNELGSSAFLAGLGFAGFSLTMAAGRFAGDELRNRWASSTIIRAGGILGTLGLAIAILLPYPVAVILGFTLTGIGFALVVPLLFSAAGKIPGVAPGTGIGAIATAGIIGFLIAPPTIGFVAEKFGLGTGLGFVAFMVLVATLMTYRIRS